MGMFSVHTSNNIISFRLNGEEIGQITNAQTDSVTNELSGTVNFPNLVEVSNGVGSPDSAYNENLTYVPDDIFEQFLINI